MYELFGAERERAIAEHIEWARRGQGRQHTERVDDYPLALWLKAHSAKLAKARTETGGYYRNTKPKPRGRR